MFFEKIKTKKIFEIYDIIFKEFQQIEKIDQNISEKFDLMKIELFLEYYTHYLISRNNQEIFDKVKISKESIQK